MTATQGTSGFGTLLQRGDSGVGAGVKAYRSMGTANKELVVGWNTAGTVGNSKTVEVIENGVGTALSVTVSTSAVVINVETDGSQNSVSTVNDVIAKLYANETFATYWFATDGSGDGTDLVDADFASAALTSGAAGTEIFTTIAEVTSIDGPGVQFDLIDATHMESPGAFKEYLPGLLDGTEVTFELNYLPADANQGGLRDDQLDRVLTNYRIVWPDEAESTDEFAAYCTNFTPHAGINDKLSASATLKISGEITRL